VIARRAPRAAVAAAVAVSVAGCFTWGEPRNDTRRIPRDGDTQLRTDALPGRGVLQPDGSLRFEVDATRLCQRARLVEEQVVTRQDKQFSTAGIVGLIAAGAFAAGGVYNIADGNTGAGGFEVTVGLAAVAGLMYFRYVRGPQEKVAVLGMPQPRPDGVDEVPCGTRAAPRLLGVLTLTTSWGERLVASPGTDGVAVFPVDWATAPTDPDAPGARDQLAVPWSVTSSKTGLAGSWAPTPDEITLGLGTLRAARAAAIVTSEPPELAVTAVTVDGDAIQPGTTAVLRVAVENRGGGTAIDLRAITRSSVPALHGLGLVFSNVQPRTSRTRTVEVAVPAALADTEVTIVLEWLEQRGHTPPETTARFAVSRPVCPEGQLDRADFEQKLDKLRRLRDGGSLSQADYDRYEAELVRCLR
jgi:hypothetical protein